MIRAIVRLLTWYRRQFTAPTITELVEREMLKATLEADQAKHTIRTHNFTLHMARARIAALEAWNHGEHS